MNEKKDCKAKVVSLILNVQNSAIMTALLIDKWWHGRTTIALFSSVIILAMSYGKVKNLESEIVSSAT